MTCKQRFGLTIVLWITLALGLFLLLNGCAMLGSGAAAAQRGAESAQKVLMVVENNVNDLIKQMDATLAEAKQIQDTGGNAADLLAFAASVWGKIQTELPKLEKLKEEAAAAQARFEAEPTLWDKLLHIGGGVVMTLLTGAPLLSRLRTAAVEAGAGIAEVAERANPATGVRKAAADSIVPLLSAGAASMFEKMVALNKKKRNTRVITKPV